MKTNSVRFKDAQYLLEDPVSGMCIRLHSLPVTSHQAPQIVPRLTHTRAATCFPTRRLAEQAQARYVAGQPLEIVRRDA